MSGATNPTISLSLPLAAVNIVLQALAARPFGEVAELIGDVQRQAQAALASPEPVAQVSGPQDAPAPVPVKTKK